jgi:hypothetical protein
MFGRPIRVKIQDLLKLEGYTYIDEAHESREPLKDVVCLETGNVYCFNTVGKRAYPHDNYTAEAVNNNVIIVERYD